MHRLPDYKVLDFKLTRLPQAALRELQGKRLRAMAEYVYDAAPFWRKKFDAAGLRPEHIQDLNDLPRIPFSTKSELQADQAAHPPFGSYVASDSSRWVKFVTTSGTTGKPLRRVFSARDWNYVLDRFQRDPTLSPGEIVLILGPVDGMMGPTASAESAARQSAMVVYAGLFDTSTKIKLIHDLRPAVVSGTPSYLLHIAEIASGMGAPLRDLGVRSVVSVGEPGAAVAATRERLAEEWSATVSDGYGITEIFPLGGSCPRSTSLHIHSDLALTEVVNAQTGDAVPAGEPGEIVFTNLVGDTQPLLRYRSGDIARLANPEPCACGFTGARLLNGIEGRADDMIWFRGVNIFPTTIEAVLYSFPELGHEYQIVIDRTASLPSMWIGAELRPEIPPQTSSALEARIKQALVAALKIHPQVELLRSGDLRRSADNRKVRRVVDKEAT